MKKLVVNYRDLYAYGKYLDTKAAEFKNITSRMKDIINNLKVSWDGADANNFIANSTTYLDNLKVVENDIYSFGSFIRNRAMKYDRRELNFIEKFNERTGIQDGTR